MHEFLDEINQPFYFYQFAEAAAEKGLQFLAEAWQHTRLEELPPPVQQTIRDISPDLIHSEQYLDFLRQRTFRRTLLCHDSIALSRSPTMDQILEMSASAMAWPLEEADPHSESDVMRFRTALNHVITTNHPAVTTVFLRLSALHPQSIPVRELLADVHAGLARLTPPVALQDTDLAALLVRCYLSNSLMFHVHPPRFASALSERPEASAFCRVQAGLGPTVANQSHRQYELNDLDRQILVRLDGKHDRRGLVAEIRQLVQDGTLTADMLHMGAPEVVWQAGSDDLEGFVDVSLQRLLSHAFLSA